MTVPDSYAAAAALREAQLAEYSKYMAKDVIYVGGARAYNPGDAVPVSVVESGAVPRDLVVGSNTKAATALIEKG